MSKSSAKKSKVPKISEEEYAKYINALKSASMDGCSEKGQEGVEEPKHTDENV